MCEPCTWRCRSLQPFGHLHLQKRWNEHIHLTGMDADKEGCSIFLQVLVTDMKRGQFLWRGCCCHILKLLKIWTVTFTVIHNQSLWFCKYNNSNRYFANRVTTQVTTFCEQRWKPKNSTKFILHYFSAFCVHFIFIIIRPYSQTQVLVAPLSKIYKSLILNELATFSLFIIPKVAY